LIAPAVALDQTGKRSSLGEVVPYGRIRNAIVDCLAGENLRARPDMR
jgi:hypothetical protein